MNDLLAFTTEELSAELSRRAKAIEEARLAKININNELIFANIDVLLNFTEHSKTTCDDGHFNNYKSCVRCILLNAKDIGCLETNLTVEIQKS